MDEIEVQLEEDYKKGFAQIFDHSLVLKGEIILWSDFGAMAEILSHFMDDISYLKTLICLKFVGIFLSLHSFEHI